MIGSFCNAQEKISFPVDNPLYSSVIRKGWSSAEYKEYKVFEIYNKDETIGYSIYELETVDLFEAVQRIHKETETEFVNHEFGDIRDEELNGIVFHRISGSGTTSENEIHNFEAKLFKPETNHYFMIYYSGALEKMEYYQIEIDAMNNSINKRQPLN